MKSKVYFIPVTETESISARNEKLKKLIDESKTLDFLDKEDDLLVKMHFGEHGNTGYVNPEHIKVICDEAKKKGAKPFLSDANTLYRGRRTNSKDHLELAHEHGFTKDAVGVDVFIPDDLKAEDKKEVEIRQKYIKTAKIAKVFLKTAGMLVVTHFKGHLLSGFGGAIKNIAMGCATREGKLAQHCDVAPAFYKEQCVGCGECQTVCPVNAISMENDKSKIDKTLCIGCANCVGICPTHALFVDLEAGGAVQYKMAEYTYAVLRERKHKTGFITFAVKINKECDCWGGENSRIAPDVGILASLDPVAIDKACLDLVTKACNRDIFKETHPEQDGNIQIKYAAELGLGSMEYELVRI